MSSVRTLAKFLLELPDDLSNPDIILEDDGDYSVNWYFGTSKVISVSCGNIGFNFSYIVDSKTRGHGFIPVAEVDQLMILVMKVVNNTNRPLSRS